MFTRGSWRSTWRWVVGAFVCLVLGWFAFVREVRVPVLGLVDLGFHELGHLLTYRLPHVVTAAMGSIFQIAVPLGIAVYFLWRGRDAAAGAMCLAWAGSSAQDVSVYVADAPYQRLQLIGGEHDWAFVLGHFHALNHAAAIAAWVKGFGLVLVVASLALCCAWPFTGRQRGPEGPLVPNETAPLSGSRRAPSPAGEPPAAPWGGGC
ncbi:MAG: hypothetical protein ACJ77A_12410 [Actinomycetota bacterium]